MKLMYVIIFKFSLHILILNRFRLVSSDHNTWLRRIFMLYGRADNAISRTDQDNNAISRFVGYDDDDLCRPGMADGKRQLPKSACVLAKMPNPFFYLYSRPELKTTKGDRYLNQESSAV